MSPNTWFSRPRLNAALSVFIVIGIVVLVGFALVTLSHTDAARENTRVTRQTSDRTECIRAISNELDHAHWSLVADAFNAQSQARTREIGLTLKDLPLVIDVANEGGSILGKQFEPCPPAPLTEQKGQ